MLNLILTFFTFKNYMCCVCERECVSVGNPGKGLIDLSKAP